jgi:protein-disulfide isomerase
MEENSESVSHEAHHESHHSSRKPLTEILRKNPWILSTVVLGIFVVLLVIGSFGSIPTGNSISESDAGKIIVNFAQEQTGQPIELDSVTETAGIYEVNIIFQNQTIPLYLTKDGENLIQGLTPLSSIPSPQDQEAEKAPIDVPKTDKPTVELFVMTHCPYGTQAEKGYIPAILELGNNIDASVKFVHYFLHEPENAETPKQICIREEQASKYNTYLKCFLEDGDSDRCITEAKIDEDKLNDCIDNGNADKYYASDSELSQGYGVQGSPTLVVNGVIVQSGRSADAYFKTICSAFNSVPAICGTASLDSASPSPGFGYGTTSGIANAQC